MFRAKIVPLARPLAPTGESHSAENVVIQNHTQVWLFIVAFGNPSAHIHNQADSSQQLSLCVREIQRRLHDVRDYTVTPIGVDLLIFIGLKSVVKFCDIAKKHRFYCSNMEATKDRFEVTISVLSSTIFK